MPLEDYRPPTKILLSALWAATMFRYVYGDYFGLFVVGALKQMGAGIMGLLGPATPAILIAVSLLMAVPCLIVVASLVLSASASRYANILLGLAYTLIMAVSLPGSEPFYIVLGIVEMALTFAIVLTAGRWPRVASDA